MAKTQEAAIFGSILAIVGAILLAVAFFKIPVALIGGVILVIIGIAIIAFSRENKIEERKAKISTAV